MMPTTLAHLLVPIAELHSFPGNPRRGDLNAIKASLQRLGQYRPVVVNRRTMQVLAGNHVVLAAEQIGWSQIAVTVVDCDEEEARRIVLVDNRANDLAGYDAQALVDLLGELPDLEGTGYDERALDALLDEVGAEPLVEDEVPAAPVKPRTRVGDRYRLGRHVLVCGDARERAVYDVLLGDEQIGLLWTDPPYGVDYEGKTSAALRIEGDRPAAVGALLAESFATLDPALAAGAALYVCHPAGALCHTFTGAFLSQGWQLRQTLIWLKDQFALGHSDYHYVHEPILYGYKPGAGRRGRGADGWYGGNAESSVLEVPRPHCSREHPTMKPPELVERCLLNSSRRGELVLDPFAGSGTTLVACERNGRRARLVELDPRYCDVIVARYEALTGAPAVREVV